MRSHRTIPAPVTRGAPNGPLRTGIVVDNTISRYGYTPLHVASKRGRTAALLSLLAAGADLNSLNNEDITPLHEAVYHDNPGSIRLLLAAGAEPNRIDEYGSTPLYMVAMFERPASMFGLLLDAGADPNIAGGGDGTTALSWAVTSDNLDALDAVALLLQHGAGIDLKDDDGDTACGTVLDLALARGNTAMLALLQPPAPGDARLSPPSLPD